MARVGIARPRGEGNASSTDQELDTELVLEACDVAIHRSAPA
jgi:hypothetical protein